VVDRQADGRVGAQVADPPQLATPLRLLVDRRVKRVADRREADRDDVRTPARVDRGEMPDPGGAEQL
jgi:hypothetical protein